MRIYCWFNGLPLQKPNIIQIPLYDSVPPLVFWHYLDLTPMIVAVAQATESDTIDVWLELNNSFCIVEPFFETFHTCTWIKQRKNTHLIKILRDEIKRKFPKKLFTWRAEQINRADIVMWVLHIGMDLRMNSMDRKIRAKFSIWPHQSTVDRLVQLGQRMQSVPSMQNS